MSQPTDQAYEIKRPGTISRNTDNLAELIGKKSSYSFDLAGQNPTFTIGDYCLEKVQTIEAKVLYADVRGGGTMVILKHPDFKNFPKGVIGVMVSREDAPGTRPEVDGVWVADEGDGLAADS